MRTDRRPTLSGWRPARLGTVTLLCVFSIVACKTSDDATAAATQMAATAKGLSDYYTRLGRMLADTDKLYELNDKVYFKPYTDANKNLLKHNQAELAKRAALAGEFSTLAGSFAELSSSTTPADVATSAAKLDTEIDTLDSHTESSLEQTAIKEGLTLIVTAIKERKERQAAKGMEKAVQGLTDFFVHEEPAWKSVETNYSSVASELAGDLLSAKAIDTSALASSYLKVVFDPFGLAPAPPSADLVGKLAPLMSDQIKTRTVAMDSSFASATTAMAESLQEMEKRIELVADDKPMAFRLPPLTLATVAKWVNDITAS